MTFTVSKESLQLSLEGYCSAGDFGLLPDELVHRFSDSVEFELVSAGELENIYRVRVERSLAGAGPSVHNGPAFVDALQKTDGHVGLAHFDSDTWSWIVVADESSLEIVAVMRVGASGGVGHQGNEFREFMHEAKARGLDASAALGEFWTGRVPHNDEPTG